MENQATALAPAVPIQPGLRGSLSSRLMARSIARIAYVAKVIFWILLESLLNLDSHSTTLSCFKLHGRNEEYDGRKDKTEKNLREAFAGESRRNNYTILPRLPKEREQMPPSLKPPKNIPTWFQALENWERLRQFAQAKVSTVDRDV